MDFQQPTFHNRCVDCVWLQSHISRKEQKTHRKEVNLNEFQRREYLNRNVFETAWKERKRPKHGLFLFATRFIFIFDILILACHFRNWPLEPYCYWFSIWLLIRSISHQKASFIPLCLCKSNQINEKLIPICLHGHHNPMSIIRKFRLCELFSAIRPSQVDMQALCGTCGNSFSWTNQSRYNVSHMR